MKIHHDNTVGFVAHLPDGRILYAVNEDPDRVLAYDNGNTANTYHNAKDINTLRRNTTLGDKLLSVTMSDARLDEWEIGRRGDGQPTIRLVVCDKNTVCEPRSAPNAMLAITALFETDFEDPSKQPLSEIPINYLEPQLDGITEITLLNGADLHVIKRLFAEHRGATPEALAALDEKHKAELSAKRMAEHEGLRYLKEASLGQQMMCSGIYPGTLEENQFKCGISGYEAGIFSFGKLRDNGWIISRVLSNQKHIRGKDRTYYVVDFIKTQQMGKPSE